MPHKELKLTATGPHAQGVAHPDVRITDDAQSGHLVITNDGAAPLVVGIRYEDRDPEQVQLKPHEVAILPLGTDPHYLIYEEL